MVAGLLISPVLAAATATLFAFVVRPLNDIVFPWGDWGISSTFTDTFVAFALVLSALTTLILAAPAVAWLRRRRTVTVRIAGAMGALIGMAPFVLITVVAVYFSLRDRIVAEVPGRVLTMLPYSVAGATSGFVTGLCFWRIAVKNNAYFRHA